MDDNSEHLLFGSGFAGPDLKLARALVYEHLDAGNDWNIFLTRHAQQRGIDRVIDHVEDEARIYFLRFENMVWLDAAHAYRGRVQDDVELCFGELLAFKGLGFCLA